VTKILKALYGEKLAPICGLTSIKGGVRLFITCPKLIQQIYTDLNKFHTKHWIERAKLHFITPGSIINKATEDSDYHANRKAISSAFMKKKMMIMIQTIKNCTLEMLKETENDKEINIAEFTNKL